MTLATGTDAHACPNGGAFLATIMALSVLCCLPAWRASLRSSVPWPFAFSYRGHRLLTICMASGFVPTATTAVTFSSTTLWPAAAHATGLAPVAHSVADLPAPLRSTCRVSSAFGPASLAPIPSVDHDAAFALILPDSAINMLSMLSGDAPTAFIIASAALKTLSPPVVCGAAVLAPAFISGAAALSLEGNDFSGTATPAPASACAFDAVTPSYASAPAAGALSCLLGALPSPVDRREWRRAPSSMSAPPVAVGPRAIYVIAGCCPDYVSCFVPVTAGCHTVSIHPLCALSGTTCTCFVCALLSYGTSAVPVLAPRGRAFSPTPSAIHERAMSDGAPYMHLSNSAFTSPYICFSTLVAIVAAGSLVCLPLTFWPSWNDCMPFCPCACVSGGAQPSMTRVVTVVVHNSPAASFTFQPTTPPLPPRRRTVSTVSLQWRLCLRLLILVVAVGSTPRAAADCSSNASHLAGCLLAAESVSGHLPDVIGGAIPVVPSAVGSVALIAPFICGAAAVPPAVARSAFGSAGPDLSGAALCGPSAERSTASAPTTGRHFICPFCLLGACAAAAVHRALDYVYSCSVQLPLIPHRLRPARLRPRRPLFAPQCAQVQTTRCVPTLAGWGHLSVRPVSSSARNPATVYDALLSECGDPPLTPVDLTWYIRPLLIYPAIPVYNGAGGAGCAQPVYVPAVPGFAPALPVHSPARAPLATDPSSSTITGDEASAWLDASLPDDRPCFASGILLHMAPGSPSGYRGVTFDKARNRYKAQVSIAGRRKSICTAPTAVEAAMHPLHSVCSKCSGSAACLFLLSRLRRLLLYRQAFVWFFTTTPVCRPATLVSPIQAASCRIARAII